MRTFIAIPLPDNIHKELSSLQDRLKKSNADIKWVRPANIHITLKFLGNTDDKTIDLLSRAIREQAKSCNSFDISILNTGAFPKLSHPQTIWAGICDHDKPACVLLQKKIELCAKKSGFSKEGKDFFPHIAIGRVRSQKNRQELVSMLEKEKDFSIRAKIPVTKVVLFSSLLTQKGSVYSALEEFPLPVTS